MLTLHIRYLTGRVCAADASDREQVEWPPHPARVFMALAAAHFETGGAAAERRALEWLEALPAPQIHAGEPFPRNAVTHFVPTGDHPIGKKPGPLQSPPGWPRTKQHRTFASAALENECAALCWPQAEANGHFAALAALCAKVTRIGHSISLVQVWAAPTPPDNEPSHEPNADAARIMLRVSAPGLLGELQRRFNADRVDRWNTLKVVAATAGAKEQKAARKVLAAEFPDGEPARLRPMVSLYAGYAPPRPAPPPGAAGTVWTPAPLLYALERASGPVRALDIAATLQLTARLRDALLQHLGPGASEALSGHKGEGPADQPHLAIFPLPFVGHEHADGHLLGLGLALPRGLAPADRRRLLLAMEKVRSKGLKLGALGCWKLPPADSAFPRQALFPDTWTAMPEGATQWATVTPYVCDRHSKAKDPSGYFAEMAGEIAAAWRRIAPDPSIAVFVQTTPVSAHLGAPPSHQFPRLRRKDGSERRQTHAILTFSRPVIGPLLLGAGRFRGYGLCRPLPHPAGDAAGGGQ